MKINKLLLIYVSLHKEVFYPYHFVPTQTANTVAGKFLGIVGQDPSDSKSSRLHVDIFRVFFHSFGVYSIDSSRITSKYREVSNFNRFMCN